MYICVVFYVSGISTGYSFKKIKKGFLEGIYWDTISNFYSNKLIGVVSRLSRYIHREKEMKTEGPFWFRVSTDLNVGIIISFFFSSF